MHPLKLFVHMIPLPKLLLRLEGIVLLFDFSRKFNSFIQNSFIKIKSPIHVAQPPFPVSHSRHLSSSLSLSHSKYVSIDIHSKFLFPLCYSFWHILCYYSSLFRLITNHLMPNTYTHKHNHTMQNYCKCSG